MTGVGGGDDVKEGGVGDGSVGGGGVGGLKSVKLGRIICM